MAGVSAWRFNVKQLLELIPPSTVRAMAVLCDQ